MSEPDIVYECHEADTSYRIIPNPDDAPGAGFRSGATIQWRDKGETGWKDNYHIAPEALEAVGKALVYASKAIGK